MSLTPTIHFGGVISIWGGALYVVLAHLFRENSSSDWLMGVRCVAVRSRRASGASTHETTPSISVGVTVRLATVLSRPVRSRGELWTPDNVNKLSGFLLKATFFVEQNMRAVWFVGETLQCKVFIESAYL